MIECDVGQGEGVKVWFDRLEYEAPAAHESGAQSEPQ